MTTIPKAHLQQELKRPDVTQAEKDIINDVLNSSPEQSVPRDAFLNKLDETIGPLKLTTAQTSDYADYGLHAIRPGNRNPGTWGHGVSIEDRDMRTTVYESPIELEASNHFGNPNYFGHTRSFDEDGVRHVIEVQSDVAQHFKTVTPEVRAKIEKEIAGLESQRAKYDALASHTANWNRLSENEKRLTLDRVHDNYGYDRFTLDQVNELMRVVEQREDLGRPYIEFLGKVQGAMRYWHEDLVVNINELRARLGAGESANVLEPMIKNWPKRLVREEIAQVARETMPDTRKYLEDLKIQNENYLTELRKTQPNEQVLAQTSHLESEIKKIEGRLSNKIRFATADTVAKVEGWPVHRGSGYNDEEQRLLGDLSEDILRRSPGISDAELDRLMTARSPEVVEKLKEYVKNLPVEDRLLTYRSTLNAEAADAADELKIPQKMKFAAENLKRAQALGRVFEHPGHAGIYLRHRKEVEDFLKREHDGIVKTDSQGHTWVEVPIQPQNRRVQLLGVGAGAASAGLPYSMSDQTGED
jgi:hypothetical protein